METLQYASKEAVIEAAIGFLEENGRDLWRGAHQPEQNRGVFAVADWCQ